MLTEEQMWMPSIRVDSVACYNNMAIDLDQCKNKQTNIKNVTDEVFVLKT